MLLFYSLRSKNWQNTFLTSFACPKFGRVSSTLYSYIHRQEVGQRSRYSDWLWAGRPRSRSSSTGGVRNFLFSTSSRPALGPTQPPIQWVPQALSPGVKRRGREADHSPPISAEVKKTCVYTSTTPNVFMA
jgi:hypothetical protein